MNDRCPPRSAPSLSAAALGLVMAVMLAACSAPPQRPSPAARAPARPPASTAPAATAPRAAAAPTDAAEGAQGAEGAKAADGSLPAPSFPDSALPQRETGLASWYGSRFHGRRTASGERYDQRAFTAAHRSLPFQSRVRVRHLGNGREVVVRITDRGPHVKGRIIDLSRASAQALGLHGLAQVSLEPLGP